VIGGTTSHSSATHNKTQTEQSQVKSNKKGTYMHA
jgi:hypothetical protein